MTNQEMLLAAIEFEEVSFAYDLLFLIQEGYAPADSEFKTEGNDWNKVNAKITDEWKKCNLLGFDIINLYCVRLNVDDWEIFAARSDEEARGYMLNKYRFLPKIIKMEKSKWLKEFYFQDSKQYKTLLDIKKENDQFPRTLLIF